MVHHAYIDESGTREHQEIMTVAAAVFEGARSAARLHESVMSAMNPRHSELVRQLKKERRELPCMHFSDLSEAHKARAALHLAKAKVSVFSASFWYESSTMDHEERFSIYTELVKMVITAAFHKHVEMNVVIAKQGGWQDYERDFLAKLKAIPKELSQNGAFRKGDIYLVSAARAGIQLADFYVGSIRAYHRGLPAMHDLIKHQVLSYDVLGQPVKKRSDHC